MVYQNGGPGSENPDGSDPPVQLVVSAAWPVRVGAMPPLAERYTLRPESGHDVALALTRNPAVALTPRVHGADATPSHDLLRCTGKTQLAVQCAESQWQARAVDLLIWIDGSTRTSVLLGYADVATAITGSRPAGTVEAVTASFLYWLSQTKQRWLIFIDDVPDAEVMEGLWPVGAAGRVVITTRSVEALVGQPDVLILEVGSFSPREAMSYLLSRLSQDSDQRRGAFALIEDLGCQPLALTQATGAIGSSWLTCADYREQFYQRMRAMAASGGLPPAAGVTWTFSLELARRIVPAEVAQSCLAVAALLDGHGTPAALFETEAARDYIAGTQRLRAQAAERVQAALTALELGGLLQLDRQSDPSLVRMNPALQRVVRLAMSPDLAEQAVQAAAAAVLEAW
ncbi:MAG: hypothetical protein J2P27_01965, partial [Actinobacteria bacterium]|nr:hypothetical protein [Actinomycetota bacterium]